MSDCSLCATCQQDSQHPCGMHVHHAEPEGVPIVLPWAISHVEPAGRDRVCLVLGFDELSPSVFALVHWKFNFAFVFALLKDANSSPYLKCRE